MFFLDEVLKLSLKFKLLLHFEGKCDNEPDHFEGSHPDIGEDRSNNFFPDPKKKEMIIDFLLFIDFDVELVIWLQI